MSQGTDFFTEFSSAVLPDIVSLKMNLVTLGARFVSGQGGPRKDINSGVYCSIR